MTESISRKHFLKNTAAASLAVATASVLSGCSSSAADESSAASTVEASTTSTYPEVDICGKLSMAEFAQSTAEVEPITDFDDEETFDVVIVGAGAAGMPAAIAAYEAGASVCVLQKDSYAQSQGSASFIIDEEKTTGNGKIGLVHKLREFNNYRSSFELNLKWADNNPEAMEWFISKMVESGLVEGHGPDTDFFVAPESEFEFEDGTLAGNVCICTGTYTTAIQALGETYGEQCNLYVSTPAVQLIKEDDRVVGVYANREDGTILKVNANKGVILATGDYQNNDAMVAKYVPDCSAFAKKQAFKTGDGHLMGMMVGGKMQNAGHTKMVHTKTWGGCTGNMKSLPFMGVNMDGVRFTAEDLPYDLRNNYVKNQPEMAWLAVFDNDYVEQYSAMGITGVGSAIVEPDALDEEGDTNGCFVADTLDELAEKIGVPADALKGSVERYNDLCEAGSDSDFGKPSKYMVPIKQAPFRALRYEYAVSAITSGLEINADCAVLDNDRNAIDGLFAIGNCSGPFYGGVDYPLDVPGLSVSRCITFGYIAGKHVASL